MNVFEITLPATLIAGAAAGYSAAEAASLNTGHTLIFTIAGAGIGAGLYFLVAGLNVWYASHRRGTSSGGIDWAGIIGLLALVTSPIMTFLLASAALRVVAARAGV